MRIRTAYTNSAKSGRMLSKLIRDLTLSVFLSLCVCPHQILGQDLPEYDEISIFLEIPRFGGTEIDAAIRDEELYLPVTDLFDFLKIRNIPAPGLESISGFFINPEATYLIDRPGNRIVYQGKTYNLEPGDLIRTESNLYLRSSYYGQIFGLECTFNFRSLSVAVDSKLELPYIRELRLEEMRRNLTRLKGETKADTDIGRTYPLFKFGMADWSVIATEEIDGKAETRLGLSLGSMIAGGEATASLYYNSSSPFKEKYQQYLWRFVNNDFKPLRQVLAGKIATHATSSIFSPVVGVQFTNTPTTFRRSFGTYRLNDMTEPGWIVELYINNILVDYIKADASGFFTFEVPLIYGNSMVKLRFFGPWGEERTREQNISIPFNFLPPKTLEYTLGAGIVEDTLMSRFSRADVNYGVTRNLTVGAGAEYLSSLSSNPLMPFVKASLRLTNNFLVSGEYTYGVRAKGTLTYRLPSNLQFDLNYTWYEKDQKAIFYSYREERRAAMSLPLKIGKLSSYNRFTVYQIILPAAKYLTGEWMFSGSFSGVSTNLTTYGLFMGDIDPNVYSNLSLAFRFPAGFILMPQTQFGYTPAEFISAKIRLEKLIHNRAFLNLSYEQNFRNDLRIAELGFRYDFSFAQAGMSVRQANKTTSFVQYARGSLINDRTTRYLGADNRTNVGRGGISIIPYLDLNSNRKRDPGEPKAYGLNLRTNGGRIEKNNKDTTIHIIGLEPYTDCFIELDQNSFDNIAWRLEKKTLSVAVDPNILKLIEIPVMIAGEANGTITLEQDGVKSGLGRIIVNFFKAGQKPAGRTLSEEDGYFSLLGLPSGAYEVRIDTGQLHRLGMTSDPETLQFTIAGGMDGDIVDNLDFTLRLIPKPVDTTAVVTVVPEEPVIRKDTTYMIIHEVVEELVTITEDSWAIQLGAFKQRSNAETYRRMLEKLLGKKVVIVIEGDFFKVRIQNLRTRQEVDQNIGILAKNGVTELWVIQLKAKLQQRILIEKQDTIANISEIPPEPVEPSFSRASTIQVGAFKKLNSGIAFKDTLMASLNKPVLIIREDDYYKVRITGFESEDELASFIPSLKTFGLKIVYIPPVGKSPGRLIPLQPREEVKPVTRQKATEVKPQQPVVKEAPAVREPTIALQVGIFYSKFLAYRAQRRISTKLKLPVEVVLQWNYYHVIITGFYTREETFRYYPELAELGYPGVSLIENYKRPK